MCCSPEKRALKAQRKLDRAQRRMDSKAAKYGLSCRPLTHNCKTNNYSTTFDPAAAMSALRTQDQEHGTTALSMQSDRAPSTNPPSYGAAMGSEYESYPTPSEKSGPTTDAMMYASSEHACCAGTCGRGGCGHGACRSGGCQHGMGSRSVVGGCGQHIRRGGCGGMLVRLVKGAYEANKERKAARQVAEVREY